MAMPRDDSQSALLGGSTERPERAGAAKPRSFFEIPTPLKRVFDKFPLVTYAANERPQRAPKARGKAVLYIFTTQEDAQHGRPSYNPGCLKWQAYLKFCDVEFLVASSNNHASPSGALPYVQPVEKEDDPTTQDPISTKKLKKWIGAQKGVKRNEEELDPRYDAYMALIEGRLRRAWLYQLYLAVENSQTVDRLYITTCSTQPLVQMAIAQQLRAAAETELVKSCRNNIVSTVDLIREADEAFQSLSALLGEDHWFFSQSRPGFVDASLFAYTHLILDESFQWRHNPLGEHLRRYRNLVRHSERIGKLYF